MVNGYQSDLVCQSSFLVDATSDKFSFNCDYVNSVETIGNKFLVSGGGNNIYTYGNFTPGLPKSIVREFNYDGGVITNMYYAEDIGVNLYYFYTSSKSGTATNYIATQFLNDESTAG